MKEVLNQFLLAYTRAQKIEALSAFTKALRPGTFSPKRYAEIQLSEAIAVLEEDDELRLVVARCIHEVIESSRLVEYFAESGIPSSSDFFTELFSRLRHKILPELQPENSIINVFQEVFPYANDEAWIAVMDRKIWVRFFSLLIPIINWRTPHLLNQLSTALSILSVRVAAAGLEKPIVMRLPVDALAETFSEQAVATDVLLDALASENQDAVAAHYPAFRIRVKECAIALEKLKEKSAERGTSLEQTFLIRRIEAQLQQMEIIGCMLFAPQVYTTEQFCTFFINNISYLTNKYAVIELLQQNVGLLSYQIAEHKSKSGEHYITSNKNEFKDFFVASCKGGVIIAFVVIAKIFIHDVHAAPFWEAVLFSLNYAAGFILIHITHSALATKQPAMTASKIAASLDTKKGDRNLRGLAILVAQTSRSQLISFAGNLFIVFPLPFILAYFISTMQGSPIVTQQEAAAMLKGIHPFESLAWLYAAFTGVFLFISGIISGYWDNRVIYGEIPERIRQHPWLKKNISSKRLNSIAEYVEKNTGALVGNLLLGFFLGTAAFIGNILGVSYDIRHITIAAGNFAIGVLGAHNFIPLSTYIICFIGVIGIGLINFAVSFTLAFFIAVRSRGIQLKNIPEFNTLLLGYFKKYPGDFIRPPRQERKEHDW